MKKILLGLLLLSMLGCTDKTDKNGFYVEGKNISINKETQTKYDKNGYDKDGYNKENWNKENINKETGTKYDKLGYNNKGFNKNGIYIKTETIFDKKGNTSLFSMEESDSLFKVFTKLNAEVIEQGSSYSYINQSDSTFNYRNDNFIGEIWSNNDFHNKLPRSSMEIAIFEAKNRLYLSKGDNKGFKNFIEYRNFIEQLKKEVICNFIVIQNLKKEISFKLSLGIYSFESPDKIEKIEILAGKNNIFNLNFENSKKIELKDIIGKSFETRVFLNFISLNLDNQLYDFLIKIPLNEQIEVRFLTSSGDKRYNLGNIENLNLIPFLIKYNELKNKLN